MSRTTPQMRKLAEFLIASETRGKVSLEMKSPPAFDVCEKLRPYLATLMGKVGFHALLSRALAVAGADDASLRSWKVNPDGSLGRSGESGAPVDSENRAAASAALVSQLLTLLVAFIGENLTVRVVRELWPKLPLSDVQFEQGDKL